MVFCAQGITGYDLGGPVSSEHVEPFIVLIFISTSTVSMARKHLIYPCKKLHSALRTQAIWKISYIFIQRFCNVICTVSCVPAAKVNHVITCLSIMWKSRGLFFINHLILILSWSIIVATLGKLIWISLKVTLTSFQAISRVYQM